MKSRPFLSEFKCRAALRGWKLTFVGSCDKWKGAVATILEDNISTVWGCVWKISSEDVAKLGYPRYKEVKVRVLSSAGEVLDCIALVYADASAALNKPSPHLKMVLQAGAMEHQLPADYMKKLEKIEHNGHQGVIETDLDVIKNFDGTN